MRAMDMYACSYTHTRTHARTHSHTYTNTHTHTHTHTHKTAIVHTINAYCYLDIYSYTTVSCSLLAMLFITIITAV